jgi:hypothetical protein
MKDLLFFDGMVTPKMITLLYWLLLVAVLITALGSMFGGLGGLTFGKFMLGIGIIVGGSLVVRIACELVIVLFKIYESAKIIAAKE